MGFTGLHTNLQLEDTTWSREVNSMVIFRAPGMKKLPPLKHPDPTETGHLLIVIIGCKWDYTFYKRGFKYF